MQRKMCAGTASLSLLLSLSQDFAAAGHPNSTWFQTAGELLRTGRDLLNHIGMILPWMAGGLILCWCLFRMKRIPGWLALWGIAGSASTLLSTLALMLGFIKIVTPIYIIMNIPTAAFELSLAVYLMAKGFRPAGCIDEKTGGR